MQEKTNTNEEVIEVEDGEDKFNELLKELEKKFIDDSKENISIEGEYNNEDKYGIISICSYKDSNTPPRITKRIKAEFINTDNTEFLFYKYKYDKMVDLDKEVKKGINRIK